MLDQIATWADKYQALANIVGLIFGGPALVYLINALMKAVRERDEAKRKGEDLTGQLAEANVNRETAQSKLRSIIDLFENDLDDIWTRSPILKPMSFNKINNGIPIMVIANLKGGVGKTTLAANLAAYFEHTRNERILAIDLDYQGSLSSMLLNENANRNKRSAKGVKDLLVGTSDPNKMISNSYSIRDTQRDSRILECESSFSNFETRVLLDWILNKENGDCRYNIANVLLSDEIQDQFQRIIIDAPPRITAGFIASLCTATHLVVPTVLDVLSAERVGLFLKDIRRWQEAGLIKKFENDLFVVGTMKRNANGKGVMGSEQQAIEEVKRQLRSQLGSDHYFIEDALVARKEDIAEVAGLRIAYFDNRSVFDPLGDRLFKATKRTLGGAHESRSTHADFAAL
jgi:cellulose biosynthesis protein BcsQ